MIKKKVIDMAQEQILEASNQYKTIELASCRKFLVPLINGACHFNSVHELKNGNSVSVVECLMVDGKKVTAHYICMNEKGEYYDPTLGWQWSGCDYKLVRHIHPDSSEITSIYDSLMGLKKKMI